MRTAARHFLWESTGPVRQRPNRHVGWLLTAVDSYQLSTSFLSTAQYLVYIFVREFFLLNGPVLTMRFCPLDSSFHVDVRARLLVWHLREEADVSRSEIHVSLQHCCQLCLCHKEKP